MSLDLSGLNAYTDEHKLDLIKKSILKGRSVELLTIQPDIKSSATINIIDSTLTAQAGACGWSEAGTTELTQREISVDSIKVNEAICLDSLEAYYTQKMMNGGSYNEEIPFEAIYAEEKADKLQALIEDLIWKGDKASGSGNLAFANGFLQLFDGSLSGSVVDGNIDAVSSITSSNIIDVIDGIVESVPADIIDADDLHLYVSYEDYRRYAKALRDANLFHYTGEENQGLEFSQVVPGTNVRVVAVRGLNGTSKMVLSRKANLYFGCDLLNDAEDFKIFYSEDNDEVRFRSKWKQGTEVAFPEFVVYFKLA